MGLASLSSLHVALVSETFLRLTVPIRVLDVLRTVCKYLVFRGKPAGRLALFRYLKSWFIEDLWPILVRTNQSFWFLRRVCLLHFLIHPWYLLHVCTVDATRKAMILTNEILQGFCSVVCEISGPSCSPPCTCPCPDFGGFYWSHVIGLCLLLSWFLASGILRRDFSFLVGYLG